MNTKPDYYWPIWKKLAKSVFLIAVGSCIVLVIYFIKFVALFKESWKGRDVPWVYVGLMNVFFHWDAMWKQFPPSHY